MIVSPARFDEGRTVWRWRPEAGEEGLAENALWIDGFVRPVPSDVEAVWLTLVLAPLARTRLELPGAVSAPVLDRLRDFSGLSVVAGAARDEAPPEPGGLSATLVRDPLDLLFGTLARTPTTFAIESHPDPRGLGTNTLASHVWSNAGVLRRRGASLDGLGELATLVMLAPLLRLERIDCFLCRDELGEAGPARLQDLAAAANLDLRLPLGDMAVGDMGRLALALGVPVATAFRSLWNRYRMFPAVMSGLHRSLESSVRASGLNDPSVEICRQMAERGAGEGAGRPTRDDVGFDRGYFVLPT